MRVRFRLLPTIPFLLLLGCGTVLEVHEEPFGTPASTRAVKGIPFFRKVPRYRQETEYRLGVLTAEISVFEISKSTPKPVGVPIRVVTAHTNENEIELRRLARLFDADPKQTVQDVAERLNQINAGTPVLTGNRIVIDAVIDRSRVYYLNSDRPFSGSGKLSFELAPDQTLVKAEGTMEDKTLSAILDPVTEVVTSSGKAFGGASKFAVEVKIERQTLEVYRFRKLLDAGMDLPESIKWNLPPDKGVEFELEVPKGQSPPPSTKKQFKFEGTVTSP